MEPNGVRHFYSTSTALVALMVFVLSFVSSHVGAADFRHGDRVEVSGVLEKSLFVQGDEVRVEQARSNDDLFIAGGTIELDQVAAENVFIAGRNLALGKLSARLGAIAGGSVSLTSDAFGDLIAAAGSLTLEGTRIDDDLVLAGGSVTLSKDTRIGDSVVLMGRDVSFSGEAGGDVDVSGENVRIAGVIGKDLRVRAERLMVAPDARIEGDLRHDVRVLQVDPSARIAGRREALAGERTTSVSGGARVFWAVAGLLFFLGLVLMPVVVSALFPQFTKTGSDKVRERFWDAVGRGIVLFLVMPMAVIFLFATVVGAPLGFFLIPFSIVIALVAWAITALSVGRQLEAWYRRVRHRHPRESAAERAGRRREVVIATLLGAAMLSLLLWLPGIGLLVSFMLFIAGLGATYKTLRSIPT